MPPSPPEPVGASPERRLALDAARAPLHPRARETLLAAVDVGWADDRRLYAEARTARRLLDQAREVVAAGLGVRAPELSFLPAGWALRTAADAALWGGRRRGSGAVASAVEQGALLEHLRARATRGVGDLVDVGVDRWGRVDGEAWATAVAGPGVALACLQQANGEVGTTQPLVAAHERARAAGVPLLVDAAAALGRVAPPAAYDVLVGSASSFAGPPLDLLVVREGTRYAAPGARLEAEGTRAPAAPWVPLALAAAEAWQQVAAAAAEDERLTRDLVERIRAAAAAVPDVDVVGDPVDRLPHVVTFSALYADGEALVHELDRRGFAVGSGSACTASTLEPSHVLAAMGALTHGNVRVTLPLPSVTPGLAEGVDRFCGALAGAVDAVRATLGARDL